MSAFMCNRSHIAVLSAFYADSGYGSTIFEDEYNKTFTMLDKANAESIKARYGDKLGDTLHGDAPNYFRASEMAARLGPAAIIKACHCLQYQSCEIERWEGTPAHRRLVTIEHQAASMLPEYKAADWELPDTLPDDGPVRLFGDELFGDE